MTGRVTLRHGRPDEARELSELAFRSKAHWGYDAAFMEACRAELTVTPEDFSLRRLTVADVDGTPGGFSIVATRESYGEVVDLWVDPPHIGAGVGRALWEDAVSAVAASGLVEVRVEADPNAEAFYRKMGARKIGTAQSESIPGRRLPLLAIDV